jgi:hypothetical protein
MTATLLLALLLVIINLGSWIYGIYCYAQAFRFRRRGLPHYGIILTGDQVQPAGLPYLRRWGWAWLVGFGTSVLVALLP